jgi:alkylated DNA repair dioxygenase AlkB
MLHTPWDAAPTLVRNKYADGVQIEVKHWHGYKVSIYTFKGIDGCFMHLAASKQLNEEPQGANEMFAEIQTVDMGLERRVFAVSKMSCGRSEKPKDAFQESQPEEPSMGSTDGPELIESGEPGADKTTEEFAPGDLMTAFSMNYGMPYKFVASGGSQSFDAAPWPVTETRRRLNWAQKTFLSNQAEYMDFNEQLIFAYLEGQKIEYHDDGESGLGPRIATLSLGGRAKMHLRMIAKHHVGCSKTGIFTEERPVPGSIDGEEMYKKRLEKWEELQALKVSDPAAYSKRRKEIPKELGLFEKKMKKADDLVTVTLNHGDIIIMDGYDIQKYLEHKVVPEGYLRFALTCRTVLPDHLKAEELPSYKVEVDPITYDGPKLSEPLVDE